jgi:hypothetical protein
MKIKVPISLDPDADVSVWFPSLDPSCTQTIHRNSQIISRLRMTASHHSAYAAIALFIATVTTEAWLGDGFDGLFDGATGAGRKSTVERERNRRDGHGGRGFYDCQSNPRKKKQTGYSEISIP